MDIRQITDDYAVSGQISQADIAEIKAAGYRSVICHRPDGEQPDQPTASEIGKAAQDAGLGFRHVPVVSGAMTQDDVDAMAEALKELEGPVFAYCRSGARSTKIYLAARQ
jgi:uncharacterized protein (TIGR01244 family)